MNSKASNPGKIVDMHCHVGLLGDTYPHWGRMSEWYRRQAVYRVFLIDVNYQELQNFFPGHPMFTNFNALL